MLWDEDRSDHAAPPGTEPKAELAAVLESFRAQLLCIFRQLNLRNALASLGACRGPLVAVSLQSSLSSALVCSPVPLLVGLGLTLQSSSTGGTVSWSTSAALHTDREWLRNQRQEIATTQMLL